MFTERMETRNELNVKSLKWIWKKLMFLSMAHSFYCFRKKYR